ncbi:uncharacterized protein A4U43_C03F4020 [Asparagus officinalis]|uniref:Uncharacterized protein n=1 Tax=Asparagus officinalis TaxID=4686 RepID=A0A5P1FBL5_ASPOF|nr:uncharacterized protein A4U43_C03F4020 [Asparagus officinalis]
MLHSLSLNVFSTLLFRGGGVYEDSVFEIDINGQEKTNEVFEIDTNGQEKTNEVFEIDTNGTDFGTLNKEEWRPTLIPKQNARTIDEARFNDERLFGKTYTKERRIRSKRDTTILLQGQEPDPCPDPGTTDTENIGTNSESIRV